MKKQLFISADFETLAELLPKHNIEIPEEYKYTPEVYGWGLILEDTKEFLWGIDMNEFMEIITSLKKDYILYFYNGAKFDTHFLVPEMDKFGLKQKINIFVYHGETNEELLAEGYAQHTIDASIQFAELNDLEEDNNFNIYKNKVRMHNKFLKENEYRILVDENHKIMEIKIGLKSSKAKGSRVLIIRDSKLLFNSKGLKEYGEILNKHYKTTSYSKMTGAIDYLKFFKYKNKEEFANDGKELEYLKQDCFIQLEFLLYMDTILPRKNWKMTGAGTGYAVWKYGYFGKYLLEKAIESGDVIEIGYGKGEMKIYKKKSWKEKPPVNSKQMKDLLFEEVFPLNNITAEHYEYYMGGLTGTEPQYRGLNIRNILGIDVSSSYPDTMFNYELPFGEIYKGDVKGLNYKWYEITVKETLYNKKGLPFIQVYNDKSGYSPYQRFVPKGTVLKMCSNQYKQFKKYYDTYGKINIKITHSQATISGKILFGPFIDHFYKMKAQAKADGNVGLEFICKLMLNVVYGKFGTKNNRVSRIWNEELQCFEKQTRLSIQQFYLPLAIAITEISRMKLVIAVGEYGMFVLQWDTDSLFIRKEVLPKLNVTITKGVLGGWEQDKFEYSNFVSRRSKQYLGVAKIDGERKIKMAFAGSNFNNHEDLATIENFICGVTLPEQKRPDRYPTGVSIEEYDKEIKPIWHEDYVKADVGYDVWFKSEEEYYEKYDNQMLKMTNLLQEIL